jgi:hypothetical protein
MASRIDHYNVLFYVSFFTWFARSFVSKICIPKMQCLVGPSALCILETIYLRGKYFHKYHFHITVSILKVQDILHNIVHKFLCNCSRTHSGTVCCTYSALYGFNQCIVVIEYVYN